MYSNLMRHHRLLTIIVGAVMSRRLNIEITHAVAASQKTNFKCFNYN